MNNIELKWLSKHLGHNISTDTNFYRLHKGIVELTKISSLLMAADDGNISKYSDKKIADISINGKVVINN